jgi:hypothetical protein
MNRWTVLLAALLLSVFAVVSCSSGNGNPVLPNAGTELTNGNSAQTTPKAQTHLWGYYDLYFDFENQTVEAVPNRNIAFSANVVGFVNKPVSNLGFGIWGTPVDPGGTFVDVDIDVSMSHPFPGLHQYDGYDVRGIFMGNGNQALSYGGGALTYAEPMIDAEMNDYNPDGTNPDYVDPYIGPWGDPDGYTRWFNAPEFTAPDPLGYVPGALASKDYTPESTLNPYKYFCDGLGPDQDLWDWLSTDPNSDLRGIFTAGSTNTRNYYLRFPTPDPNVTYGYAIVATWGEAPDENPLPENCIEAVTCTVSITDNIYYVSETDNGGNFIADIDIWGWDMSIVETDHVYQPSHVYIESDVFSANVEVPGPPAPGGAHWSTWSIDVAADDVDASGWDDFWVICQYDEYSYTEAYTVPGTVPDEPMAAFFNFDLWVSPTPYCDGPVLTSMSPAQGSVDTAPTVNILGTFCDGAASARLVQGATEIIGSGVTFIDTGTLEATFDLTGAPLGMYTLYATHCDCPTETSLVDAFEVIEVSGPVVTSHGDLPSQDMTSNTIDMSVQGTSGFGYDGVYYWSCVGTTYQCKKFDLTYSDVSTVHVTIVDPFFSNVPGLMGGPQYMEQIEVMANGPVIWTTNYQGGMSWGGYPGYGPVWWCGSDGIIDNGYLYFNMEFHDITNPFAPTGRAWGFWGNRPAGVDGATFWINAPYGAFDYGSYTGYYPADHAGGVDGQVSDNEADNYGLDSDPEGISSPFNCIHYYLEEAPDPYGVEIMENVLTLAFPVSLGTIDEQLSDWAGTPVDIDVAPTFTEGTPSAAGNWVVILEDSGGGQWSVSAWEQDETFKGRDGPFEGIPLAIDTDVPANKSHVWVNNGGTIEWHIVEYF